MGKTIPTYIDHAAISYNIVVFLHLSLRLGEDCLIHKGCWRVGVVLWLSHWLTRIPGFDSQWVQSPRVPNCVSRCSLCQSLVCLCSRLDDLHAC